LAAFRRPQPRRRRHRRQPRAGDGRLPLQQPRGRRAHPAAPPARLAAGAAVSAAPADLAWLGAHAAARLPREVRLRADGPLAATVEAEIARLRELAEGTAGSLHLWDPEAAAQEAAGADGPLAPVLDELAAAGE